jgi:hypothetical protein
LMELLQRDAAVFLEVKEAGCVWGRGGGADAEGSAHSKGRVSPRAWKAAEVRGVGEGSAPAWDAPSRCRLATAVPPHCPSRAPHIQPTHHTAIRAAAAAARAGSL